ncbi:MAG: diacylglycerol/lipid kinase family protein [Anaerolineae bacterium]
MSLAARNIHVIINPVSGTSDAPFNIFGQVLADYPHPTTVHITKPDHDAPECVQDALHAGADLVIAYGGDGTVMSVANALHGHDVPLAIVPGGTANVVAHELNIPDNAQEALARLFNGEMSLRWIDAGKIGDQYFLLRTSIGWQAEVSQRPTTEEKSLWGRLAYTHAGLQSLSELEPVTYRITLDDDTVEEVSGIDCSLCNIGNIGIPSINISTSVVPDDGYLNVLVLQNNNLQGILDLGQNLLANILSQEIEERLLSFKAKRITVDMDQPQRVSIDGDALEMSFPLTAECVPNYIAIMAPEAV